MATSSQEKRDKLKEQTTGTGLYLFRNTTKEDIMLPKISNDGKQVIPSGGCFRGDDYFLKSMRGSVSIVEDLSAHIKVAKQILVEQPATFCKQGVVELKDSQKESVLDSGDVLLLEHPIDCVTILD